MATSPRSRCVSEGLEWRWPSGSVTLHFSGFEGFALIGKLTALFKNIPNTVKVITTIIAMVTTHHSYTAGYDNDTQKYGKRALFSFFLYKSAMQHMEAPPPSPYLPIVMFSSVK